MKLCSFPASSSKRHRSLKIPALYIFRSKISSNGPAAFAADIYKTADETQLYELHRLQDSLPFHIQKIIMIFQRRHQKNKEKFLC